MESLSECALKIEEALKTKQCITLYCHCSVVYSGRAESFLDLGDRLIFFKQDGTLLIHQPTGSNPVNYMKPETLHKISMDKKKLLLHAKHIALKEFMDITIDSIYHLHTHKLEDTQSIIIQGTEKDMSEMIFKEPSLIEQGFTPLSREEHTQYGFIDVFGYDSKNTLVVIECKRFLADPKAVDQLHRYVRKIKSSKGLEEVRGILVAPKISPNAEVMLREHGFEFISLDPPKYLERFNKDQKALADFS